MTAPRQVLPVLLALFLSSTPFLYSQPIPLKFSQEEILKYTQEYEGERFPDGRPKVSSDLLERMKLVTIEEAWSVLRQHGYHCQFEQGWTMTHENPILVGRAVTCSFLPHRPDIADVINAEAREQGYKGRDKHWVMDKLEKGDVIVADLFGKSEGAGFVGDNLATMIHSKTGTGIVVDGGCRDMAGVLELPNFYVFNRNWHPTTSSAYDKSMVISTNTPIRIGKAVVLPGDVVLGLREGIIFVPAHLALEVVETSEVIRLKDEFGFERLKSGIYSAGQIDDKWTEDIRVDFLSWLKKEGMVLSDFQKSYVDQM